MLEDLEPVKRKPPYLLSLILKNIEVLKTIIVALTTLLVGMAIGYSQNETEILMFNVTRIVEIEVPINITSSIVKVEKFLDYKHPFEEIALEVAGSHDYSLPNYVCEDFSTDLVKALNDAGYKARKARGVKVGCNPATDYYDCRHTWVQVYVDIEATSGRIMDPIEIYENYKYK